MGSGKSYEVVSQVILKAISNGRRVVTNVDGIDGDAIRAYVHEKHGIQFDRLGDVVHCSNEDVAKPDFLPHGKLVDTFVQPGDMVCIDEAWRFWGTDCKLLQEHKIFFREHRHYVNPETKVSCDLVLMVQDISDLHRTLKVVVELTFRTEKKKSLGLNNTYSVSMYEGYKVNARQRVGNWVRRYEKEIFPLYSSYSGGEGKEVQVDSRQNIFNNPRLWFVILIAVLGAGYSAYNVFSFFNPEIKDKDREGNVVGSGGAAAKPSGPVQPGAAPGAVPLVIPSDAYSPDWRYVGEVSSGRERYVMVAGSDGRVRLESPSVFNGRGLAALGYIDGQKVTSFSGNGREVLK